MYVELSAHLHRLTLQQYAFQASDYIDHSLTHAVRPHPAAQRLTLRPDSRLSTPHAMLSGSRTCGRIHKTLFEAEEFHTKRTSPPREVCTMDEVGRDVFEQDYDMPKAARQSIGCPSPATTLGSEARWVLLQLLSDEWKSA